MKHCNNLLEPLKNIKEIQKMEKEAWMDTMDKTEMDCIWVILKKVVGSIPTLVRVFLCPCVGHFNQ